MRERRAASKITGRSYHQRIGRTAFKVGNGIQPSYDPLRNSNLRDSLKKDAEEESEEEPASKEA